MSITLTIDDRIATVLQALARRSGASFRQVVNDTLHAGLAARDGPKARSYRLKPASLGSGLPGIELTKALLLATELEDDEIARKLERRE